jgi:hypothetical protein
MSMCNVLGVLDDDERLVWETLEAAVELAEAEHSRLTLAKTCELNRYMWACPFPSATLCVAPAPHDSAQHLLAGAVERVPMSLPVTTLMLGSSTIQELRKLLRAGHYDAIVAPRRLLSARHRLAHALERDGIRCVPVPALRRGIGQKLQPGSARLDRGLDPLRKGGRVLLGGADGEADQQLADPVALQIVVDGDAGLGVTHGL